MIVELPNGVYLITDKNLKIIGTTKDIEKAIDTHYNSRI